MGEAVPALGPKELTWEKAAVNVQLLDEPHEKKREQDQLRFLHRIPKAALASILSSWLYFAYSFKCLLDSQAAGLSGTPLTAAWLSYALQLGTASEDLVPASIFFDMLRAPSPRWYATSPCPFRHGKSKTATTVTLGG